MSGSESSPTTRTQKRWPRLRPQFSLRLLLLAFTAFALGFPIWYRWPYVEVEEKPEVRDSTTWRRTWGGGRVKHGEQRRDHFGRKIYSVSTYREGVLHGPNYQVILETYDYVGEVEAGKREGVWDFTKRAGDEHPALRVTYRKGLAEGVAE